MPMLERGSEHSSHLKELRTSMDISVLLHFFQTNRSFKRLSQTVPDFQNTNYNFTQYNLKHSYHNHIKLHAT